MKKLIFITLCTFYLAGCFKIEKKITLGSDHPEIQFLKNTDATGEVYLMDSFNDNEEFVKYLVDFLRTDSLVVSGARWIVTDRDGIEFEDNYFDFRGDYQKFTSTYEIGRGKLTGLRVNFLDYDKIAFDIAKTKDRAKLTANFDSLDLAITQSFLTYTRDDAAKRKEKTYTYELYNGAGIKKIVQVYHNLGEWFTIDIL